MREECALQSIMKLLPPSAKIKEGSICVNGQDITCYREKEMQKLRGRVFYDLSGSYDIPESNY